MYSPRSLRLILAALLLTAVACWLAAPCARAQQNTVDPVFGGAGLGLSGNVFAVARQPDGKLVVAGANAYLVRLNADGSTDTSFQVSIDFVVAAIALQPDGKILMAGNFRTVNGVPRVGVVRLNPDGSTDTSFENTDPDIGPNANVVVPQPDGKVLIGGFVTTRHPNFTGVARLNADGSVDTDFHAAITLGTKALGNVAAIALQPDGKIFIGGQFIAVNGTARSGLARLLPDGTMDGSFADNDVFGTNSLTLQPDGKLMVAGNFSDLDGFPSNGLARLNEDGSVDTAFRYTGDVIPSLASLPAGGSVIVSGYNNDFTKYDTIRVNPDGSVDPSFLAEADSDVVSQIVLPDGTILLGGDFSQVNGTTVNGVVRLLPSGALDPRFAPDIAPGPNQSVEAIAVLPDGSMYIGGSFTQISGATHYHVARLKKDGTVDTGFSARVGGANSDVAALALQPDGKLLVGGKFSQVNGTAMQGVARLNPDGSLDPSFQSGIDADVSQFKQQSDGKIVVMGHFYASDHNVYTCLTRLNLDGSVDPTFQGQATITADTSVVYRYTFALAIQPDDKILLGGAFVDVNGQGGKTLVRLNADGTTDPEFYPAVDLSNNNTIDALCVRADGTILVGGYFQSVNATAVQNLALLDGAHGGIYTSFKGGTPEDVYSLLSEPDGTIVVGGIFTEFDGVPRQGLVHLAADGTISPYVTNETGVNGSVYALYQQTDGKVIVGGSFSNINGAMRNYIARLSSGGVPDFFYGAVPVGGGFYYQQFASSSPFGYYNLAGDGYAFPYVYHLDLGMEYFFDAQDGHGGGYFYDFASDTFFYTSPLFPWPYLYDFKLNAVLYYYPDPANPGRYNTNGVRYFYNFATGQIITK